ncbi:MAG: hypothetical protein A2381_12250 [Bdellovibrionales bacterium RIFOXYB1_FULL_37_110]|nr:MAG: hypothetical protein A2181_01970 [Bdellovibrionales bacterium RIFOXYA1_FULL_38_20]OFZ52267.1 MAG: hypothetical protein A2417_06090 [Bdellovibrionales bacterium RIFOXYC1_FULL_37_79]OFZ57254.1 MAG: hypothetical protein A2381_12250 [Bdellovibrionales bacterium RIFOXYB1_FULL_37_110]OFZ65256.1 MAG: hypothetical protein A2577_04685 [Bdellovibrionales bacterium RIFOXYD1_FULL_36_51]
MSKVDINEIEELIRNYSRELYECSDSITSHEEELGLVDSSEKERTVLEAIQRLEQKKQSIEKMIFDLRLKKTELSSFNSDNVIKNILAIATIVISIFLAWLTLEQNITNKRLTEIELINTKNLEGDINSRLEVIEKDVNLCKEDEKNRYEKELAQMREQVNRLLDKSIIKKR